MNHLGNIWQTINALLQVNNFDKHFENGKNPEFTTLLDDEGIITEFKNCSAKLMKYMKLEQYEQLIKYVTEMPPEESDDKRAYKFPFVACEILTSDTQNIYEVFLNYQDENQSDNEDDDQDDKEEKQETLDLINFDDEEGSNFQCKKCKMGFDEISQYLNHIKIDSCKEKKEHSDNEKSYNWQDEQPNYRQSIKGKGKNYFNSKESEGGDMNSRVSDLEKKMSYLMNPQQFINEQEQLQAENKKLKDKNNRFYLLLQKQVDTINDKNDTINGCRATIRKLKAQMKELAEENRQLKEQQNPGQEDSIENMKKQGKYLLVYLWQFLNTEEEVNQTLAGYFTKVMNSLVNKKETEIVDFFYSKQSNIDNLMRQVQSRSLAELLLRLITFESNETSENYLNSRQNILQVLSNKINEENTDWEVKSNCTYIIGETLRRWQTINSGTDLFEFILTFLQGKIVEGLVSNNDNVVYNNTVLCNIIFQNLHSQKLKLENNDDIEEDNQYKDFNDNDFINSLESNIEHILDSLIAKPKNSTQITYRKNISPLGTTKLKTVEMIQWIFQYNRTELNTSLAGFNVFEKLLQLFIEYEWNNVLHNRISKIITQTLESKSVTLLRALFQDGELVKVFKNNTECVFSQIEQNDKKKIFRKGFLGHIAQLGNILIKMKENNEQISSYIDETKEEWEQFNSQFMKPQNDKDNKELGGHSLNDQGQDDMVSYQNEDLSEKYKEFLSQDSNSQRDDDEEFHDEEENKPDLKEEFDMEDFEKDTQDMGQTDEQQTVEQIIEKNQENQKNSQVTQNVDDFEIQFDNKEEEKQEEVQNPQKWEEWDSNNEQQQLQEDNNKESAFDSFDSTPSAQTNDNYQEKEEEKEIEDEEEEEQQQEEGEEEEEKSEDQQVQNDEKEDKSIKYQIQNDEDEEEGEGEDADEEQQDKNNDNKEEHKEEIETEKEQQQEEKNVHDQKADSQKEPESEETN